MALPSGGGGAKGPTWWHNGAYNIDSGAALLDLCGDVEYEGGGISVYGADDDSINGDDDDKGPNDATDVSRRRSTVVLRRMSLEMEESLDNVKEEEEEKEVMWGDADEEAVYRSVMSKQREVRRCRLTVSQPVLKALMVSALEATL